MTHSPDRLTPEERELASRLARIGPHGEPPAALDARILSAAHAAVAVTPARRRRWPAVLGVAATLALAIGVTWQLRPRPEASPALQEGPPAAEATAPAAMGEAADAAAAMSAADVPGGAGSDQPTAQRAAAPVARPQESAVEPSRTGAPAGPSGDAKAGSQGRGVPLRTMAPPPEEPPAVFDEREEQDVAAPPTFAPAPAPVAMPAPAVVEPPPPAPPPPPAMAAPAPTPVIATDSSRAAEQAARPAAASAGVQAKKATASTAEPGLRDVPIREDASLGPSEWLDRIRLRLAAGDATGARESLALFRRYYPDHALPEDLSPLAQ